MFRPMKRFMQQLSDDEALEVLKHAKRGMLSVTGDEDWPYGIWLKPYYREADSRIYFHGAKECHKIDSLRKDNHEFHAEKKIEYEGIGHARETDSH